MYWTMTKFYLKNFDAQVLNFDRKNKIKCYINVSEIFFLRLKIAKNNDPQI